VTISDAAVAASVEIVLERGRIVQGLVLDPRGLPVGGAMVSICPRGSDPSVGSSAVTDTEGRFSVNVPPDAVLDVLVATEDWAPAWIQGWAQDPKSSAGPTIVVSPGGRVRVEVQDGAGRPIAGVAILALPQSVPASFLSPLNSRVSSTDTTGRAVLEHLAAGPHVVQAMHTEKIEGVPVNVVEGAEAFVRITVGGGG